MIIVSARKNFSDANNIEKNNDRKKYLTRRPFILALTFAGFILVFVW